MSRAPIFGLLAGLLLCGASATAQTAAAVPQVAVAPAQRGAVFIPKEAFERAAAARTAGGGTALGLAALGAVRAGDDRINVDVLKRVDAKAEGPVIHRIVTEIYYVIDGGGMFETGGEIPDAKPMVDAKGAPTNPANIGPSLRGEQIVGGATRHIGPGDVVMIPPNVPHRFVSLDGSVTYMVVRINPGYEKGR